MMATVIVLGRNETGVVAEFSGEGTNGPYSFRYYLTDCCGTDATGAGSGVACRGCYRPLDDVMGGKPAELTETFGDGLTLDQWRSRKVPA